MSTITFPFTPAPSIPFHFNPTLDNNAYNVVCTWNLFGQRWYINIYDLTGNLILSRPMTGSPNGYNISLTAGYFYTQLVYRTSSNQFEVID